MPKPAFPGISLTANWHNDTYPAIDPTLPKLSQKGKTVIVTGGGTGIGQAIACAFAAAGAAHVAIIGRRLPKLEGTQKLIQEKYPGTKVSALSADVTVKEDFAKVAEAIGKWDVLVLNAASISTPTKIEQSDIDKWWQQFEVTTKGSIVPVSTLLPSRNANASIIAINAMLVTISPAYPAAANQSAYCSAKAAQVRLMEHIAAECPDVFAVTYHPGVVRTELQETFANGLDPPAAAFNTPELSGHFAVWLSSPEAKFLRGKFAVCGWDVEELKEREKDIQSDNMLALRLGGFPFMPPGEEGQQAFKYK